MRRIDWLAFVAAVLSMVADVLAFQSWIWLDVSLVFLVVSVWASIVILTERGAQ